VVDLNITVFLNDPIPLILMEGEKLFLAFQEIAR
jgi:hypothetical protein